MGHLHLMIPIPMRSTIQEDHVRVFSNACEVVMLHFDPTSFAACTVAISKVQPHEDSSRFC